MEGRQAGGSGVHQGWAWGGQRGQEIQQLRGTGSGGRFSPVSPPLRLASIAPCLRYMGTASPVLSSKTLPILICWAVSAGCVGRAFQSYQMTIWADNCQALLRPIWPVPLLPFSAPTVMAGGAGPQCVRLPVCLCLSYLTFRELSCSYASGHRRSHRWATFFTTPQVDGARHGGLCGAQTSWTSTVHWKSRGCDIGKTRSPWICFSLRDLGQVT